MNLSKKFSGILCSSLLFTSLVPISTFAAEDTNEKHSISNVKDLKEEIIAIHSQELSKESTKKNIEKIINHAPNKIVTEYKNEMYDEFLRTHNKISDKMTSTFNYSSDINETTVEEESVTLSDGTELTIKDEDGPVSLDSSPTIENSAMRASLVINEKFGSRFYKHTYTIKLAVWADPKLVLVTYYNASKSGLKATSSSTAGSSVYFPYSMTKKSFLTDTSAKKVGTDINAQGDYTVSSLGFNNVGIFSEDFTLRSSVKLMSINSSSVKVSLSAKLY